MPGPVTSAVSNGPNELIKQGAASVVTQTSDVTALLDADAVPGRTARRPGVGREFSHQFLAPDTPKRSL